MSADPSAVLVFAPNWLGDAVMALPAIADVRRRFAAARLIVAARGGVAELFKLVPGIDEIVPLAWRGQIWKRAALAADAARLRATGADLAVLFPNSFASAFLASQAGVAERWGYTSDLRARLLTRRAKRPTRAMHQGEYYQYLVHELAIENGPLEPEIAVAGAEIETARRLLETRGWNGSSPLITLAPGAAYGRAKQWIPSHVVTLVDRLVQDHGAPCVLVGSRADGDTTAAIARAVTAASARHVIDLAGATSLEGLAAVLQLSQACISNDSGAMHVAAALGTPVVAIFGPTIESATRPLTRRGGRADVLTHRVWCRPCMLRECPIDHRCMTGITPGQVVATLEAAGRIRPARVPEVTR